MGNQKLRSKDLRKLNLSNEVKSLALNLLKSHYKWHSKAEKIKLLEHVLEHPTEYENDAIWQVMSAKLIEEQIEFDEDDTQKEIEIEHQPKPYKVFGGKFIDSNTIHQMDQVMKLPVVAHGALMPDAHVGYGLPIGSAIATKDSLIPYAVGLDIGCRMALSILDMPATFINGSKKKMVQAVKANSHFGINTKTRTAVEHAIVDHEIFDEIDWLKPLQMKAAKQLGTSGSGNHFVEIVEVNISEQEAANYDFEAGKYVGILTHSGSRGIGATIAQYYTQVAMDTCYLPKQLKSMAWLSMQSKAGIGYWKAMNFAGDYAKACHEVIHQNLINDIGGKVLLTVENHHNFCWQESINGEDYFVHRKGATPAQEGQWGIIPSSMSTPGFIVKGKGNALAMHSASHGSGRKMSRTKARASVTVSAIKKELKQKGITLIGGGTDEAPMAYKDIHKVMSAQQDLVETVGTLTPKIVRMDKN